MAEVVNEPGRARAARWNRLFPAAELALGAMRTVKHGGHHFHFVTLVQQGLDAIEHHLVVVSEEQGNRHKKLSLLKNSPICFQNGKKDFFTILFIHTAKLKCFYIYNFF